MQYSKKDGYPTSTFINKVMTIVWNHENEALTIPLSQPALILLLIYNKHIDIISNEINRIDGIGVYTIMQGDESSFIVVGETTNIMAKRLEKNEFIIPPKQYCPLGGEPCTKGWNKEGDNKETCEYLITYTDQCNSYDHGDKYSDVIVKCMKNIISEDVAFLWHALKLFYKRDLIKSNLFDKIMKEKGALPVLIGINPELDKLISEALKNE